MNARAKTAERFFCAVAVAGLLVNLTVPTVGLRLANADDDALARGLTDPATALANRMHDFQVGRFYADARFWCDEELLRLSSDAVHGAVRVGLFFVAMLAAAWFAWEWRRSERAAWLVLISGTGFLPVTVGYQVLLSAPTLWLGWAGVWAMGALALRPESAATRCGMTAAFAVALGAHEVNAVFVVWPAMLSWFARGREGVPASRRETILCGAVLVVYGALSLWLRHAARAATTSEVYEGVKLSLDFREAFIALNLYTWSGLPGLDSWLARTSEVSGALWLSPLEWLHRAREWATGGSVAAATLLGAAVWQGTRSDER